MVGESGCGKTVTALSIVRLLQPPGRIAAGRVVFEGRDLLSLDEAGIRSVRGARSGSSSRSRGPPWAPAAKSHVDAEVKRR